MPLYEYKCSRCGDVFEVMQKFADAPLKVHESCGGAVERLLSAPALQFKGSGWYVTDYAKGNGKSPANGSAKSESKSESKESKGESKTDKKSESSSSSSASKESPKTT